MKELIKKIIESSGYRVSKILPEKGKDFCSKDRIGRMDFLLEDLKRRGLKCNSILDVGANTTSWSRLAKNIFPESSFNLIEPQLEMEEQLKAFAKEFPNSSYFLNGAGAKKDVLTLTVWDDLAGSSLLPKENPSLLHSGKQRKIEIIRIDDLLESGKIARPELIKLDIQGFELEALRGAEMTFGYTEVYILEVSLFPFSDVPGMPVISEVLNFMLARDYVAYDFAGFLRRPLDGALGQCDICFVKKDGFLRNSNEWG